MAQEEYGVVPVGLDVAARAVSLARKDGLEVYQSTIEEAAPHVTDFQLVTAIDVIEHVPDPRSFLHEVLRRLRPGGFAYIETPNIGSTVYSFGRRLSGFTGGRPAALFERLFPPQHVQYFTPSSLRQLASDAGFDVVRMDTRVLPLSNITASLPALIALGALQASDRVFRTEIIIYAVLRRPLGGS